MNIKNKIQQIIIEQLLKEDSIEQAVAAHKYANQMLKNAKMKDLKSTDYWTDKLINAKVFLNLANTSTGIETKFNAETIKVLPDAKRQLVLKLPSDLPKGKFALAALLDYGHNTDIEGAQLIIDIK